MSAIIGNETVDAGDLDPVGASGLFESTEHTSFRFEQPRERDGLLDLVLSRSYCAKLGPADREPILEAIGELYDETAGPEGIRIAYVTQCFRAQRR